MGGVEVAATKTAIFLGKFGIFRLVSGAGTL
jgi:hypothetical protein